MNSDRPAGGRLALVSNALQGPPDEGTRKLAQTVARTLPGVVTISLDDGEQTRLDKLLLPGSVIDELRGAGATVAVYIPTQGLTAATYVRITRLRRSARCKVVMIATQGRPPLPAEKLWARRLGPDVMLSPGVDVVQRARGAGIDARFLGLGVDTTAFSPPSSEERLAARRRLGVGDRPVVLHVGHASAARNLSWLTRLRGELDVDVVVVVGRSQGVDEELLHSLRAHGITVVSEFVPDMASVYAAADCYAFPVLAEQGAIGIPLSVLEAMACNLPVVSTPFGGLPALFEGGRGLFFESARAPWIAAVRRALDLPPGEVRTRALVEPHSWDEVVGRIVDAARSVG